MATKTTSTRAQRSADRRALATLAAAMFTLFAAPVIMAQAFYAAPAVEGSGR